MAGQARGIDYTRLIEHTRWSFAAFVLKLAELMGKRGGISAFGQDEVQCLKEIYDRHPELAEHQLIRAFEAAQIKSILHVALQLQNLK